MADASHLLDLKSFLPISAFSRRASLALTNSLLHWSCGARRGVRHVNVRHGEIGVGVSVCVCGGSGIVRSGGVDVGGEMNVAVQISPVRREKIERNWSPS